MVRITNELLLSCCGQKKQRSESEEHLLNRITHLSLNSKGISKIENMNQCKKIEVLYLYDNNIGLIEGLEACEDTLTQLYIQNNRLISTIELSPFSKLTKLYLDGNCLTRIEGLKNLKVLEELHLSNMKSELSFDLQSLDTLAITLVVLDVSHNNISDLSQLSELKNLRQLNLAHNNVLNFEDVEILLAGCYRLVSLDLRENPVTKYQGYRKQIIPMSGSLRELDNKEITTNEREFLSKLAEKKQKRKSKEVSPTGSEGNIADSIQVVNSINNNNNATK